VILEERVITPFPRQRQCADGGEDDHSRQKRHAARRRQAASFLTTPASVKSCSKRSLAFRTARRRLYPHHAARTRKGDGAELAMLELVGSELVKRAAERAKRKEERLKAQKEGREPEEEDEK